MQKSTAVRNSQCSVIADAVDGGTGAGKLVIKDGSTVLATFTLEDPAFGAASNGSITAASFPKTVAASASGTADNYELTDGDDTVIGSGVVGEGSGEIDLDNTDINSGQDVTISSLVYTEPAGS